MTNVDRYRRLLAPLELDDLPARSVVASALLGAGHRGIPVSAMLRLTSRFGISEGTARVALSRMVAAGEAEATAHGAYRPAGRLLERRHRQEAGRWPRTMPWEGAWVLAVSRPNQSPGRARELRSAAVVLRLAPRRPGVYLRPENLVPGQFPAAEALVEATATRMRAFPLEPGAALAAELWDLSAWARRAGQLAAVMVVLADDLGAGRVEALAPGFTVSAAVFRHLLADPLLPPALLPDDWPGPRLRAEFEHHDAAWQQVAAAWMGTADPTPLAAVLQEER